MGIPTGSLFSTHSTRIEEVINKSVEVFLPSLDPIWRDSVVGSQEMVAAGSLGRDWLIMKTYMGSLAGVLEQGGGGADTDGARADFPLYGDNSATTLGSKLHLMGLSKVFPDATNGPNATPYKLAIPLRSMVANIMLTLGELQAEVTPAFIGEVIAPKMEGFARHISQQLCLQWYLSQNLKYSLCSVPSSVTLTGDTNTTVTIDTTDANYAIQRFMVGMQVQFYDSTGATLRSARGISRFYVTYVDELTGIVKFKIQDGGLVNGTGITTDDLIVLAGSKGASNTPYSASPYFTGIAGINSWLKDGSGSAMNYLLGDEKQGTHDIDVTVHPEFKSFFYSCGSAPLTEHLLRKITRRWHAAKERYGQSIDGFIASDGVWMAYEAQRIQRQYFDRTGKLASLSNEGGPGEFLFEFDGRTYSGRTSHYIESNTVYGLKLKGGNWKRVVPPDIKNVKKFEKAEGWNPFRFVGAALTGTGTNQIPIFSVSGNRTLVTEGVQMPGWLRMQLFPDQPAGIKLTSVAEDRVYMS